MSYLHCVELGRHQLKNLCGMTHSVVVPAKTSDDALRYLQAHYPEVFRKSKVQQIYRVQHVVVNWPLGECDIVEKTV